MKCVRNRFVNKPKTKNGHKEAIEVYCRLRPVLKPNAALCMKVTSPSVVQMCLSSGSQIRNGPYKDVEYTFKRVFDEDISQKEVFETVALPLIENVLNGKNGLLFTYGVTGSGKTHTMLGSEKDSGVMPRCIDTIFNSITPCKAEKYIFKPDKLNGFEIQNEADALLERQRDFLIQMTPVRTKQPRSQRQNLEQGFLLNRMPVETKIRNIDKDNAYAVFINFVEIYNNSVYDLLEESSEDGYRTRGPQVKIIREDSDHNMFVHGVNEIEVVSANEAFEAFYKGQKRRRIGHTALNAESSRAHTIFTIRIVQAPIDDSGQLIMDKKYMQIGQLSLVDLAGSERTNRSKNTGERLREAGNINNSLMNLRTCLELLRENQKGGNKIIPYRDSRLTHLFKTYFEGEGHVIMVVCVNPNVDDCDENLQVMKFAELSQEVQVTCPTPKVKDHILTERRMVTGKDNKGLPSPITPFKFFAVIPSVGSVQFDDNISIRGALESLQNIIQPFTCYTENYSKSVDALRDSILKTERNAFVSSQEIESVKSLFEQEKEKATRFEHHIQNSDVQVNSFKRKIDEYEINVKKLKRELSEKELLINRNKVESKKVKEQFSNQMAETQEKLKSDMERKLRSQKSALEFEVRCRDRKLREAKRVLSDEALRTFPSTPDPSAFRHPNPLPSTPLSMRPPSPNFRSTSRKLLANRRPRRSRSADTWLEHRVPAPTNLPTVLQPVMKKRKSLKNLTDASDLNVDRYCLVTQGQDSDGDLEARFYKGDVVPTTGGGAQVTFSDVEILKQKSPLRTPARRVT